MVVDRGGKGGWWELVEGMEVCRRVGGNVRGWWLVFHWRLVGDVMEMGMRSIVGGECYITFQ